MAHTLEKGAGHNIFQEERTSAVPEQSASLNPVKPCWKSYCTERKSQEEEIIAEKKTNFGAVHSTGEQIFDFRRSGLDNSAVVWQGY